MTTPKDFDRRTVLRTIGAASLGTTLLSGVGSAKGGGRGRGQLSPDLEITGGPQHTFSLSTDEVSSGWNSVVFNNRTDSTHFTILQKLPTSDGEFEPGSQSILDYFVEKVTVPFQKLYDTAFLKEDPRDTYHGIPEKDVSFASWFFTSGVVYSGGPGLTSPGGTAMTTVNLDPGDYIVECYVKSDNDPYEDFHSYHGMIDHLKVTGSGTGSEPTGTLDVTVSTSGISSISNTVDAGPQILAVTFDDQKTYSNLVGHDVHLIRLQGDTNTDELNGWMNWAAEGSLLSGPSDPMRFMGGVQDIQGTMPATGYIHADLQPGEYALISEIPTPGDSGHLSTFTVEPGGG